MEVRSMLTGILSRRNTASHRCNTRFRALPLNPLLLSERYEKSRRIPHVVSSCNRAKSFPTAALSTSGIRVEGDSFLSACQHKLPCIFSCKTKTGDNPCGMPPVKNPCAMTSYGGIIRIRLKGRSLITSSQPASQAPLYLFHLLVYT